MIAIVTNSTPPWKFSYPEIGALTKKIFDDWGILVIQDLVLNHTGINTSWLRDNPQCLYNLVNSPHLKPA